MSQERPRRTRHLSADEETLWTTVTRAVRPLKPRPVRTPSPVEMPPADMAVRENPLPAKASASPPKSAVPHLAPLERRLHRRIAKGHEPLARRLDLHGYTQREAHDALAAFLRVAQADGVKVVLVVTGKGPRGAERDPGASRDPFTERGVLRRLVPHWLHAPEFRNIVLGFDAAHVGHGGEGALYVRLRRVRG
jgi:DNA-nicking Smr family endonuclease